MNKKIQTKFILGGVTLILLGLLSFFLWKHPAFLTDTRKIAQVDVESIRQMEYQFPNAITKHHCTLILSAIEYTEGGHLPLNIKYRAYEKSGENRESLIADLKKSSQEDKSKSVLEGFQEKIYCNTQEFSPID